MSKIRRNYYKKLRKEIALREKILTTEQAEDKINKFVLSQLREEFNISTDRIRNIAIKGDTLIVEEQFTGETKSISFIKPNKFS